MSTHDSSKIKSIEVFLYCLFFIACFFSIASAENYVGIILDGYQNNCIVQSRGEDYDCTEYRQLYAGDKIIKKQDLKELKIKWAPYTSGKELDKKTIMVVFEPPKDKKEIVQSVKRILGFIKTGHVVSIGATRGVDHMMAPQPGNNATMIPGQKSNFICNSGGGKYIIFKNNKEIEMFKKDLKGENSVQISPDEIGMKSGELYSWYITETRTNKQFNIRVLSQDLTEQVTNDLMEIEKQQISTFEKMIQKAVYLQFMSDAYPQDIDMYWLSYILLQEIKDKSILSQDDLTLIEDLKRNYLRHVR